MIFLTVSFYDEVSIMISLTESFSDEHNMIFLTDNIYDEVII